MSTNLKQKNISLWIVLFLSLTATVICLGLMANGETAVASTEVNPEWESTVQITDSSLAPLGANRPVVSGSPDGTTVMVV